MMQVIDADYIRLIAEHPDGDGFDRLLVWFSAMMAERDDARALAAVSAKGFAAIQAELATVRERTIEEALAAIAGERLSEPQPGTSDEGYEQALDDATTAIRSLEDTPE